MRCIRKPHCTKLAYAPVVADVVTTIGALDGNKGEEGNPIYGTKKETVYPLAIILGIARIKAIQLFGQDVGVPLTFTRLENGQIVSEIGYSIENYSNWNCLIAGFTGAAVGNNFAIWTGERSNKGGYAVGGASIALMTFYFGSPPDPNQSDADQTALRRFFHFWGP